LDPRFKDLAFARGNDQSLAKAYVFSTVREARERLSTEEEDLSAESSVEEEMEGQTSLLANFFDAGKGRKQAKSSVDQEFSIYKALPLSDLDNACPLKWWRTHCSQFPSLALAARDLLATPASSAAVERLFSKVGLTLSDRRYALSAERLRHVIFASQSED